MNYFKGCSSKEEVKIQYKELVKKYHPDIYGEKGNEIKRRLKMIKFEILKEYKTRAIYDHTLEFNLQIVNRTSKKAKVILEPLSDNGQELPCEIKNCKIYVYDDVECINYEYGILFKADRVA